MTTLVALDICFITLTFKDTTTFTTFSFGNQTPIEECLHFAKAKYDEAWEIANLKDTNMDPHPVILDIEIER